MLCVCLRMAASCRSVFCVSVLPAASRVRTPPVCADCPVLLLLSRCLTYGIPAADCVCRLHIFETPSQ